MTRIQRKRTKGWKSPEGTVYVGRPTQWGNPYKDGGRETNAELYRIWLDALFASFGEDEVRKWLNPLRHAAALSCWCPLDQPCHADVLIEFLARLESPPERLPIPVDALAL